MFWLNYLILTIGNGVALLLKKRNKKEVCACVLFQESLLEIDEEEDTTDFGEAFFAQQQPPPQPPEQNFHPMARVTHSQPWWPASLLPSRQSKHNKDIKLIAKDGGVQIGNKIFFSNLFFLKVDFSHRSSDFGNVSSQNFSSESSFESIGSDSG